MGITQLSQAEAEKIVTSIRPKKQGNIGWFLVAKVGKDEYGVAFPYIRNMRYFVVTYKEARPAFPRYSIFGVEAPDLGGSCTLSSFEFPIPPDAPAWGLVVDHVSRTVWWKPGQSPLAHLLTRGASQKETT